MPGLYAAYVVHAERDSGPARHFVQALARHDWYCWSRATARPRDVVHADQIMAEVNIAIVIGTRAVLASRLAELDLRLAGVMGKPVLLVLFEPEGERLMRRLDIICTKIDLRIVGWDALADRVVDHLARTVSRPGFDVPGAQATALQKWWRLLWYRPTDSRRSD